MAQREFQEALREQEKRLRKEFRQQQQATIRSIETRLRELEKRQKNTEPSSSGEGEQTKRLEKRVEKLELSVKRALEEVFPRVESLVSRLEEPSRGSASPAVVASKSSAGSSSKATAPNTLCPPAKYLAQWELNKQLDAAVEEGKVADVRRLLAAGAEFQKIRLTSDFTPLMLAADKGHSDVLLALLENGADSKVTNRWWSTALHLAAQKDLSGKCVVLLIGAGADVDCKSSDAWTPLHFAAHGGNAMAVEALLEAGANKMALNVYDEPPVEYAKSDVIRRLLQY